MAKIDTIYKTRWIMLMENAAPAKTKRQRGMSWAVDFSRSVLKYLFETILHTWTGERSCPIWPLA